MMTYGEAHVAEQRSLHLKNGVWKQKIQIHDKLKRMNRKDAAKYYNTKLFTYWLDQLDDSLPLLKKKQIISLHMFGHTDRHNLVKGRNDESN